MNKTILCPSCNQISRMIYKTEQKYIEEKNQKKMYKYESYECSNCQNAYQSKEMMIANVKRRREAMK